MKFAISPLLALGLLGTAMAYPGLAESAKGLNLTDLETREAMNKTHGLSERDSNAVILDARAPLNASSDMAARDMDTASLQDREPVDEANSIADKAQTIKDSLDTAVKLLQEVSREEPAFGKPLVRATMTIDTLNKATQGLFAQYKGEPTNPTGGYKSGGPRYGGRKPGGYGKPGGY